jgi:hypothetical protein
VLLIREIDLEKSVNILAILSDKEGSRIVCVIVYFSDRWYTTDLIWSF